jgi:thiamine-monophosphate kinase
MANKASSEFDVIYRYFSALGSGTQVDLGVGDDCALLRLAADERLAVSVDTLVADVHFPAESFPEDIAYRAVAVAASDLAAMGASSLGMTLALTLPEADELWLHAFSQGVAQASADFGLPLIGGDTTRGPLTISVQVMGAVPLAQALCRHGAQAGDVVWVSGPLGDGAAALAMLQGQWQPEPVYAEYLDARFFRPQPQLALGRQLLSHASAAIDVSDGLLADLDHIAQASGVGIQIDPQLLPLSPALSSYPDRDQALLWALTGGDDYQLCFTQPASLAAPETCARIGTVVVGEGVECGLAIDKSAGYQHF